MNRLVILLGSSADKYVTWKFTLYNWLTIYIYAIIYTLPAADMVAVRLPLSVCQGSDSAAVHSLLPQVKTYYTQKMLTF